MTTGGPLVDEDEARILHKRRLTREKMQRYRKGIVRKSSTLKHQAVDLQREIERLLARQTTDKSPWLLSWADVARALRDDSDATRNTNGILRQLVWQQDRQIRTIRSWVHGCQVLPNSSWRNVSLLEHPHARKHGIDWITQHLYHNTDRVLEQYAFAAVGSGVQIDDDTIIDTSSPDCFQYVWRDQRDMDVPFDVAARALTLDFFHSLLAHGTPLAAIPTDVEVDTKRAWRNLSSATRIVYVGQNIHHDPLYMDHARDNSSNRMTWVVLDKASATTTTLRKITITSQGFRRHDGRMIPLDEEASLWGVDLSAIAAPDAQLDWFAHKVTQLCNMYANMNGGMTTRLDKYLANVPH
ncbi:hypothetical protein DYB28_002047 [Aphanomyces astaci]|uniref:Uncharacterized protein n=1 Tax=Aphanomyces astaci TaxID=112090 RepID=A0A3L6VW75_APHAT|nr:hypothetical protein DYB26_006746 [Aphanomyces astaci]RLO13077.1 hypothetical protein DYB28_002047 [Aphanomyces astaci]